MGDKTEDYKAKSQLVKLKEKITISDFDGKKVRIKLIEPDNNKKAIVTHYLHNYHNGVKKHYEKDAKKLIKELF